MLQFCNECYLFFNSLIILKFTEPASSTKVKKCSRTVLEQACHYQKFNQIDVGKNMAARIGGIMKAPQKALVAVSRWQIWQYYIVWDSE